MFRFIHTSDWHLGHVLYGHDRLAEQRVMIDRIVGIVSDEQPDALLISGDIYHTAQPSASAQSLFTDAMVRLRQACPAMSIIVTAGNHDSASRHEVFAPAWDMLGVHAVGMLDIDHPDRHIFRIGDRGIVVALPYINARHDIALISARLMARVTEINPDDLPVVIMAHTTVTGSEFTGHDDAGEHTVGGIDAVDIREFGSGYDYLALGHIHCPQWVRGTATRCARYSGSPLAVSFDEAYEHSVSLVTIDSAGCEPQVRTIPVESSRPLVTLPAEGFAGRDEVLGLLRSFPDDIDAYIRLKVSVDDTLPPSFVDEVNDTIAPKKCRLCLINTMREATAGHDAPQLSVSELQSKRPADIFEMYMAGVGKPVTDDLRELFETVVRSVTEEARDI